MQKIIDYLKEHPQYAKVLIISFALIAVLTAVILILRSVVNKKRETANETTKTANAAATEISSDKKTEISPETSAAHAQVKTPHAEKAKTEPAAIAQAENSENSEKPEKIEKAENAQPIGKWIISEQNGKFIACLTADGETLLTSESYGSLSGLKSGVDTLKNNLQAENYAVNVDKNGGFYFKLFSTANRLLCISQSYPTRERCENAFFKCKRASLNAPVITER